MTAIEILMPLVVGVTAYCVLFACVHSLVQVAAVLIRGVPPETPPEPIPPPKVKYDLMAGYAVAWMRWLSNNDSTILSSREGYDIISREISAGFAHDNDDAPIREWKHMWARSSVYGMDSEIMEMRTALY